MPDKFAYVCGRTKRNHERYDREGKVYYRHRAQNHRAPNHFSSADGGGIDEAEHVGNRAHEHRVNMENGRRQQEWRARNELSRALIGQGRGDRPSDGSYPEAMEVQENYPEMQYGIHMLPESKLSLEDALHRRTWEFQAKLDKHKVPQEVQDELLKELYGEVGNSTSHDNFSGLGLGALLRHAGVSWDGGRHGIKALSSFRALCGTFEECGMPQTQRWRICIGPKENSHAPVVLPPSHQDDYNVRTGLKCRCENRIPNWKLARDCEHCSDRCPLEACKKIRKDMLRFEYFPMGPLLKKLCTSRSICHEMLGMWRERARWFGKGPGERHEYKEWWDGERAAELSYFWDLEEEFELPVLCRNCYACYGTLPNKCEELSEKANWDRYNKQYDLQCSQCGSRLTATQNITKVSKFL